MKLKIVQALILGGCAMALAAGAAGTYAQGGSAQSVAESVQEIEEEQLTATRTAHDVPEVTSSGVITGMSRQFVDQREQLAAEEAARQAAEEAAAQEAAARAAAEAAALEAAGPKLAVSVASSYVNVRETPGTDAPVVGKLYKNGVGEIQGEENGWYLISSGSVTGYVSGDYVRTGEEGEALAAQVGQRFATVDTTTLKVRMEPSTEAGVLGLVPEGDTLSVTEELDGWVRVLVEEGEGYVSTDYVELYTEYPRAESKAEEEARLQREAEERAAAQAAARRQNSQTGSSQSGSSASTGSQGSPAGAGTGSQSASGSTSGSTGSNVSLGRQIADFGLQFVGNPYVYGGTSLTNGADCSGFVQSVYKNFGISLPRTSGEQGACGTPVGSLDAAQPGDLIWYSGHIGIYIGNGQIVHASTSRTGIIVSNANYRPILSIRRIV